MNYEEQGSGEDLPVLTRCGGCRRFSGPTQGDAAAEVDEDEGRGSGGGAWALGHQKRKTMDREE